jgi:hypothetical protein
VTILGEVLLRGPQRHRKEEPPPALPTPARADHASLDAVRAARGQRPQLRSHGNALLNSNEFLFVP